MFIACLAKHPKTTSVKILPSLFCLRLRFPLYLVFVGASLLFLLVNLACALLVKMTDAQVKTIVLVRVTINDSLFVLCAISLSICLYKVAKMSLASIYLESKVFVSRETVNTIRATCLHAVCLNDCKFHSFEYNVECIIKSNEICFTKTRTF